MSRFSTSVEVRFRDLDTMGHVNNAMYATYLEQARVAYYDEVLAAELVDVETVIVHLEIDFVRPIELGQAVEVLVDVPELGRSSIPMEYEVRSDGELAATAETVQVQWNRDAGEPRPIPDAWRSRIASFHGIEG